jgi:TRAP-type mannitol/chloroaromatic compound transport system permease small subunit
MSENYPFLRSLFEWILTFHIVLPVLLLLFTPVLPSGAKLLAGYLIPLARFLDGFAKKVGHLTAWLTLLMVLVMTLVVLLRYVFGLSFIWMQESITYMHGVLFMLAAAYTLWVDGHVRVDIFYRGATDKRKALVDFLGTYFFLFPVMFVLVDTALPYIEFSWAVKEGSKETSGIQAVYLLKSVILVFAYMMILQGLAFVIHRAVFLTGYETGVDHDRARTTVQILKADASTGADHD